MTLPIDPTHEEEFREEQRAGERIVFPREMEWEPGLHCMHRYSNVHGHCTTCGKCTDAALCASGVEILNRDWKTWRGMGLVVWFRNFFGIID